MLWNGDMCKHRQPCKAVQVQQLAWRRHTIMWVGTVNKKVSITKAGVRDVLR